jgi:circadian clock protein KaiB
MMSQTEEAGDRPGGEDGAEDQVWKFRLYTVGQMYNSRLAIRNLEALVKEYLDDSYEIEIVDILEEPQSTWKDNILVTPTLVKYSPPPTVTILGNLSEKIKVLFALGLDKRGDQRK